MEDTPNSRFTAALRALDAEWVRWEQSSADLLSTSCIDALNTFCTLVVSELPSDPELIPVYHAGVQLTTVWHDCIRATDAEEVDPGKVFESVRVVRSHLDSLDTKAPVELPKVSDLLKQYGGDPNRYTWVAKEFGRYNSDLDRWEGPFFSRSGAVMQAAIEKEAREPGSVIPIGFTPPDVAARRKAAVDAAKKSLAKLNAGVFRDENSVTLDPASIDQLLEEGQFVDVIAKVKGVSIAAVQKRARELGIVPVDRETVLSQAAEAANVDPVFEARRHDLQSVPVEKPPADTDIDSDDSDDTDYADDYLDGVDTSEQPEVPEHFGKELSGPELNNFLRIQLNADNKATNQALQAAIAEAGYKCSTASVREAAKVVRKELHL